MEPRKATIPAFTLPLALTPQIRRLSCRFYGKQAEQKVGKRSLLCREPPTTSSWLNFWFSGTGLTAPANLTFGLLLVRHLGRPRRALSRVLRLFHTLALLLGTITLLGVFTSIARTAGGAVCYRLALLPGTLAGVMCSIALLGVFTSIARTTGRDASCRLIFWRGWSGSSE